MANPWLDLAQFGQSLWYDNMSRSFVSSGDLKKMVEEVNLRGITSNPAIFEKSISKGKDYDEDIKSLIGEGRSTDEIYERLTTDDIRSAADVLRPIYDSSNKIDGYVSIEVDPRLADDTASSIEAAHRLWKTIDRPNIMIKIPGTKAGLPAIRQLLEDGININITLLFGIGNYTEVAHAYLDAINARIRKGEDVTGIASVASFFLSRVDTNVDKKLEDKIAQASSEEEKKTLHKLLGQAAVANAKLAYERYLEIFHGDAFKDAKSKGAQVQRCLWASVSTKNPSYSDVLYIEPLIGPETVTTVPDDTIEAFKDHGKAANTLGTGFNHAHEVVNELRAHGIDTEAVAEELQIDGVKKFKEAFDTLSKNLESKRQVIESAVA